MKRLPGKVPHNPFNGDEIKTPVEILSIFKEWGKDEAQIIFAKMNKFYAMHNDNLSDEKQRRAQADGQYLFELITELLISIHTYDYKFDPFTGEPLLLET